MILFLWEIGLQSKFRMKLQKLNFRPKVLRREEMMNVLGGSYCWSQCNDTQNKGGADMACSEGYPD